MSNGMIIGLPCFVNERGEPYYSAGFRFAQCLSSLVPPMGYATRTVPVFGKRIDHARNEIAETALKTNAEHVLFLDTDVLFPGDTFQRLLMRQRNNPEHKIISGVYWSKSNNPIWPLIFHKEGSGSYLDWKMGDYFKTWAVGMGLVLIHTDVFRAIEPPWFEIDYGLHIDKETGGMSSSSMTEDLPFCDKCHKAGFDVWVDTGIQAGHYDRNTGITFGLHAGMPQAQGRSPEKSTTLFIGDILAGGEPAHVLAQNPNIKPTWVGPPDKIPTDNLYEHIKIKNVDISKTMLDAVIAEWVEHLKPGGKIEMMHPDYVWMLERDLTAAGAKGLYRPEVIEESLKKTGLTEVAHTKDGYSWWIISGRKPKDDKPLVSIIIIAHDLHEMTARCIQSIRQNTVEVNYEIILVDNGSEQPFDHMGDKTLRLAKNLSFGDALTQGVKVADKRSPYLLFLNNDTQIVQDVWLRNLLTRIRGRGNVAAVGPKQVQPNGAVYHAGIAFTPERIPYHEFVGFAHDHIAVQREKECLALNFGCVLVRREKFDEFPLDSLYGGIGNYEDIDWCLTLRKAGNALIYTPSAEIIHIGAVTQAQLPDKGRDSVEENRAKFQEKWKEEKAELFGLKPTEDVQEDVQESETQKEE